MRREIASAGCLKNRTAVKGHEDDVLIRNDHDPVRVKEVRA
jgi:hypothetical protein